MYRLSWGEVQKERVESEMMRDQLGLNSQHQGEVASKIPFLKYIFFLTLWILQFDLGGDNHKKVQLNNLKMKVLK